MDLTKLTGLKKTGTNKYIACCPAHDDKTASLSIDYDNGTYLYYCHAGCDKRVVTSALRGIGALQDKPKIKKRIVAEYNYTDEAGAILYQCVRYEPKDFRQRQPGPGGEWIWNLRGVTLVPYNLPAVIACERGVIICEGEKDADRLINMGICATTSAAGASKWKSSYNKYFEGKSVFIIPDNDEAGRKHGEQVASQLTGIAATVKIVELPGGEKTDVSDWLDAGGDKRKLSELIQAAPEFKKKLLVPEEPAQHTDTETDQPVAVPTPTVPSFIEWPDAKDNGTPLNTIENLKHLFKLYNITASYNVISKGIQVNIPGYSYSVDNHEACTLAQLMSYAGKHRLATSNISEYLTSIADQKQINPAVAMMESKPWDGQDRIGDLVKTLHPRDPKIAIRFVTKWLISGAACAYRHQGTSVEGVLVLQGKQGLGKSKWFKRLLKGYEDMFKGDARIDPTNKDSVKQSVKYFVVEIGELEATLRHADESLRSFLSSDVDEFRKPYARTESKFTRRTIFGGTVNEFQYLRDPEGNRRYWTIVSRNVDYEHDIDMQQVWSQAAQLYHDGHSWWMDDKQRAELNDYNENFEGSTPIKELIQERFDLRCERTSEYTATQVLIECGYDKPTTRQVRECSSTLRKLLGEEPVRKSNGRFFRMPAVKSRNYH